MSESPLPSSDAPALHVRLDDAVPVLEIPSALSFEELRSWIRGALPDRLPDINGRTCRLDLGDRELKLFDLRRLIHVLRDEFSVDITGLYVRPDAIHRYAERELKLKLFVADDVPESFDLPLQPESTDEELVESADEEAAEPTVLDALTIPTDLTPEDIEEPAPVMIDEAAAVELATEAPRRNTPDHGRRTFTVHRTLRSGAVVRFDGDIIVFGDVNPGANLIATGDVVVLGALKGMAHAGALGDEKRSILAFDFRPTQVRIGVKIAMPPSERSERPELVCVRDGEIVIEPYRGRF